MESHTDKTDAKNSLMCNICGKKYKKSGSLTKHALEHEGKGRFKCRLCREIFPTDCERTKHREKVHEKPWKCDLCPHTFMSKDKLDQHVKWHVNKESEVFVCNVCSKEFKLKVNLKIHVESRCGTDPQHACKDCGKAFMTRGTLITHALLHTGIRPYMCEACGSTFSCIGNLIKHRKTHRDKCGQNAVTGVNNKTDKERASGASTSKLHLPEKPKVSPEKVLQKSTPTPATLQRSSELPALPAVGYYNSYKQPSYEESHHWVNPLSMCNEAANERLHPSTELLGVTELSRKSSIIGTHQDSAPTSYGPYNNTAPKDMCYDTVQARIFYPAASEVHKPAGNFFQNLDTDKPPYCHRFHDPENDKLPYSYKIHNMDNEEIKKTDVSANNNSKDNLKNELNLTSESEDDDEDTKAKGVDSTESDDDNDNFDKTDVDCYKNNSDFNLNDELDEETNFYSKDQTADQEVGNDDASSVKKPIRERKQKFPVKCNVLKSENIEELSQGNLNALPCKQNDSLKPHQSNLCKLEETILDSFSSCQFDRKFDSKLDLQEHVLVHTTSSGTTNDIQQVNSVSEDDESLDKRLSRYLFKTGGDSVPNKKFLCQYCNKGFSFISRLNRHRKLHVEEEKETPLCRFCGKKYFNKACLRKHESQHKGAGVYQCRECKEGFESKSDYRQHRLKRHGREHVCSSCQRTFSNASNLRIHMNNKHTDHTPESYACQLCGKQFKQKGNLKVHVDSRCAVELNTTSALANYATEAGKIFQE
uniref:C2H2-type domain-containing protein n=1 Tax=Timema shepardi TaxID=629360 RepID=A0A7R9AYB6_TIMSH|nr:unnamed protein product [Timema shepardi]